MTGVRLIVVDDNRPFRDGLRALLATAPELDVVAEAANGEQALALVDAHQPDVVLMDLNMPGLSGVEATRELLVRSPHVKVLVLTMVEDDDAVVAALQAGARGYLLKGARKAEVVRAVHAVHNGDAIIGSAVAARLTTLLSPTQPSGRVDAFPELTNRELEILTLMARHITNPEIAATLGLTPKTVRNHVSNIFGKLQVVDRAQAIIAARDAGLS